MKEKKLLRALGNVDNQYIKEAEPMKKIILIVTALIIIAAILLAIPILKAVNGSSSGERGTRNICVLSEPS